jgi:hypothetical protein
MKRSWTIAPLMDEPQSRDTRQWVPVVLPSSGGNLLRLFGQVTQKS